VINRRQYLKHFIIILGGNGAAQIANLLSYPLLARLYSPREFGIFALFVAASAVPATIACGRFEFAITTAPKAGRPAVLWLCAAIAIGIGLLSISGGALYWRLIGQGPGLLIPVLLGLTVALTGICAAESMFLLRHDRYRARSVSVAMRTGFAVVTQILLGLFAATATSLIVGFVFGLVIQALLLTGTISLHLRPRGPRPRQMRAMFSRFRRQVTVDIPSSLIGGLANNMLTFLLAALYDAQIVGFYALGNRLAMVPLQVFNEALSQTFFQKAAHAHDLKGHFWEEMKLSLITSGLLSIAAIGGILLFAHPFVAIYLGKQWVPSADMLVVLTPMLAISAITMSIATTDFVMHKAHWLLVHNALTVGVPAIAFVVAAVLNLGAIEFLAVAAALLAFEYALFGGFLMFVVRRQGGRVGH
jgi:O-antigen/teichoic acid export membrane protein